MKLFNRVNSQALMVLGAILLMADNAHASTASQVLVFSNNLYAIANDLTSGIIPTTIALFAIGIWGFTHMMGKNLGEGLNVLLNIVAVVSGVVLAKQMLTSLGLFSVTF